MKYLKLLAFGAVLFVISGAVDGSVRISESKANRIGRVAGYLMGQQYSLDFLKRKFPELKTKILIAELEFESKFGIAKKNLDSFSNVVFGDSMFKQLKNKIYQDVSKVLDTTNFTNQDALNYIDEVKSRANGNIVSPILETLLHFRYFNNPAGEFLNGYTNKFDVTGHAKAKGSAWTVRTPKSWISNEADMSTIIQKFTSDYGDGSQMITLLVIGEMTDKKYTSAQINEYFTEASIKKEIPSGAKFVSFQKMTLNGNNGCCVIYDMESEQLGNKMYTKFASYMFYHNTQFFFIQYSSAASDKSSFDTKGWTKGLDLSKLVVNSVVFLK